MVLFGPMKWTLICYMSFVLVCFPSIPRDLGAHPYSRVFYVATKIVNVHSIVKSGERMTYDPHCKIPVFSTSLTVRSRLPNSTRQEVNRSSGGAEVIER